MDEILAAERLPPLQSILEHWEIPPVSAIATLDDRERVYQVKTAGSTFVLKDIAQAPNLTRLTFTHNVLTHVARTGLRVPIPLLSRAAQLAVPVHGQFYTLTEWIEAGAYPSDPALQPELFYNTGQAIAMLHQALAAYPDKAVSQQTWREDLAGRVVEWLVDLGAGLPADQALVVKRVGMARGVAIESALRGLPEQLIHRDCHPGNVLVQGTHVIGFIDCDHLCIGPRIFDLAYYAVHHLKWVTDDATATARWLTNLPHLLAGYTLQQPLSPAEIAAFPCAMMAYHLLLAHWFMNLPRVDAINLEVRALDWLHKHFDAIVQATMLT